MDQTPRVFMGPIKLAGTGIRTDLSTYIYCDKAFFEKVHELDSPPNPRREITNAGVK